MNGKPHNLRPRASEDMDADSSMAHGGAHSENEDSLDAGSPLKNLSKSYQLGSIGHPDSKYIALEIDNMPSLQEENDKYSRQKPMSEQESVLNNTSNNNYSSSFAEYDTVINSPEKRPASAQEEIDYADGSPQAPAQGKMENAEAQWKNYFQSRNRPQMVNRENILGSYKHNNEHGAGTIGNRVENKGDHQYYHNFLPDVSSHIIKHDPSEDEEDSKSGRSHSFSKLTESHDENDKSIFHYEFAEKTDDYTSSFYNEREVNENSSKFLKTSKQSGHEEQKGREDESNEEPNNTFLKRKKGISAFNVPQSIPEYHMTNASDHSNVSGDPAPDARNVFANLFASNIKPLDNTNNNVQKHYVNADAVQHPTTSGLSNATTAIASATSNPAFQQNAALKRDPEMKFSGHKKALSTTTPQDVGMFYDEKTGVWANPHNSSSMGSANASANTMGDPTSESSRHTVNMSDVQSGNLSRKGELRQPSLKTSSKADVAYDDSLDYADTSVIPDPVISPLDQELGKDAKSFLNEQETKCKAILIERLIQLAGTSLGSVYELDISNKMLGLDVQDYFYLIFEILPNLLELASSNTNLHEVLLPTYTNLEVLNLSNNKLREINSLLSGTHLHLRSLDLNHNFLTRFQVSKPETQFFRLEKLDLSHNSLSGHFELKILENFPNLETLDLSHNQGLTHITLTPGTKPLNLLLNNNSNLQKVSIFEKELHPNTTVFHKLEMENCLPTFIAYMNTKFHDDIAHMVVSSITPPTSKTSWKFARSLKSLVVEKYWSEDYWYRLNKKLERLMIRNIVSDINLSFSNAGDSCLRNDLSNLHALSIANTNLSFPLSSKYEFLFKNLQIRNLHELNVKENVEIKSKIYTPFDIYDQDRVERLYRHGTQKKFGGSLTVLDGEAGFFDWSV
ncbi:hypothetical protein ACO0QE_003851 [Hanseniaspora vineae]